ncbi:MAG: hypothetical protein WCG87_09770 [Bacteroidota bacterium]
MSNINDFFEAYAKAVENYDTKLMVRYYALPCTLLSDESTTIFTEASKLEGLFNQGTGFYKQFGIAMVIPDLRTKQSLTDMISTAKVNWKYLDALNQPIYDCEYHYILKQDKQTGWKILTSISVNEKENMDKWLSTRKKKII